MTECSGLRWRDDFVETTGRRGCRVRVSEWTGDRLSRDVLQFGPRMRRIQGIAVKHRVSLAGLSSEGEGEVVSNADGILDQQRREAGYRPCLRTGEDGFVAKQRVVLIKSGVALASHLDLVRALSEVVQGDERIDGGFRTPRATVEAPFIGDIAGAVREA